MISYAGPQDGVKPRSRWGRFIRWLVCVRLDQHYWREVTMTASWWERRAGDRDWKQREKSVPGMQCSRCGTHMWDTIRLTTGGTETHYIDKIDLR